MTKSEISTLLALEGDRVRLTSELEETIKMLEETNTRLRSTETNLTQQLQQRTRELEEANERLRQKNAMLQELAVRDGLTGLFNQRYLTNHLELEMARSRRYDRPFSVLFVDIDNFKQINDRYGHPVGDQVLCQLADLLVDGSTGLRRSDVSARCGGDEFCLVLPETGVDGGQVKAERLREEVAGANWKISVESDALQVTASFGVAGFPKHGGSATAILSAADSALYRAKQNGRNRVAVAQPENGFVQN